jgi:NAD(P)H-dependent FMN reductase
MLIFAKVLYICFAFTTAFAAPCRRDRPRRPASATPRPASSRRSNGVVAVRWSALLEATADSGRARQLLALDLSLLDETHHARLGNNSKERTRRSSATITQVQRLSACHPEYTRSFPTRLNNALDYLKTEWINKFVGSAL